MDKTLVSVLAGIGGMLGWGTSDFFANIASEKIGHFKSFFWSQLSGLILVFLIVLLVSPSFYLSPLLVLLTIFSGVAYAVGYLLFYKGFEIGNVSVVSAVINSQNLFIIAIAFFLFNQRLSVIQIPALIIILLGITLVSVKFQDLRKGKVELVKGVKETLVAAIAFGVFYWPLNEYIVERSDWLAITLLTKLIAIVTVFVISKYQKSELKLPALSRKFKYSIIAVGLLEATGVLSVSFGLQHGDSILVSPIASALTVVTVTLAVLFLKERVTKTQTLGIGMTVLGIILTTL